MTYQNEFTLSEALLGQLTAEGLEALPTLFQVLLNAAMQIERQKHLGAAPHERTQERTGHANGYKDKTLNTRLGQITVAVPQVREVNGQGGGFYPQSLERGTRSERALKLALAEMYVQGIGRVALLLRLARKLFPHSASARRQYALLTLPILKLFYLESR